MQAGQRASQLAIAFFRPGRIEIAGTQARFNVRNWNLLVVGREAGGKGGRGITVDQHNIRFELCKHAFQALQDGCAHICQVLAGLHDIQVEVWGDRKQVKYLIKHFSVLACHTNLRIEAFVRGKGKNQRGHLDSFGPSAEDAECFH
ncbi:hypothetical protein D9M71_480060 [compost metagenome]